jgi:hypothetical protein
MLRSTAEVAIILRRSMRTGSKRFKKDNAESDWRDEGLKVKGDMAKTAGELSPEELRSYRPRQTMERHRKDPEVSRRREDAWKVARIAGEMLKRRFGAKRVV